MRQLYRVLLSASCSPLPASRLPAPCYAYRRYRFLLAIRFPYRYVLAAIRRRPPAARRGCLLPASRSLLPGPSAGCARSAVHNRYGERREPILQRR
jgi:hypothetical protein